MISRVVHHRGILSLLAGVLWEGLGAWAGLGPSAPFAFGAATAALATGVLMVGVPSRR